MKVLGVGLGTSALAALTVCQLNFERLVGSRFLDMSITSSKGGKGMKGNCTGHEWYKG